MQSRSTREGLSTFPAVRSSSAQDDTGWLITLSDLTLLLLCFLAFWYIKDRQSPANLPVIIAPQEKNVARKVVTKKVPVVPKTEPTNWLAMRGEIETYIEQLGLAGEVRVESAGQEVLLSLNDTVPFASGRADLRPRALPILEKVAVVALRQPTLHLEINGHTDDRPITSKKFPSNWELSTARASGVARYLIEKGIHPTRLSVQGFANTKPRVLNSNPRSRGINRRVEIRLFQAGEQVPEQQ